MAPDNTSPESARASPVKMGSPSPPAPMNAANVAAPTVMTAAVTHSSENDRCREREPYPRKPLPRRCAHRLTRLDCVRVRIPHAGVRVPRDRVERVQPQCDQRRASRRRPARGIMKARSAMLGMVWSTPSARTTHSALRRARSRPTPSGTATSAAARSAAATSSRWRDVRRSVSVRRDQKYGRSPPGAARSGRSGPELA